MKKILLICSTLLLLSFSLAACGDDPAPTPTTNPTVAPVSTPEPTATDITVLPTVTTDPINPEEFVAILYDSDNTDIYREVTLKKGMKIDYAKKIGYDFDGYWTEGGNPVCYIDGDGKVVKPYIGADTLYLKPKYIPWEFKVSFYDGKKVYDTKTVNYDAELHLSIYLGVVTDGNCVVRLETENGTVVASSDVKKGYSIHDLKDCGGVIEEDLKKKTVKINLVTEPLEFLWDRYDTYNISESGFLKQSLNTRGAAYDEINLADYCDLDALETVGYKNLKLTINCEISATNGKQFIKLLSSVPQKDKDIKNATLVDCGTISLANKEGEYKTYEETATIPLESLINDNIYIVYNASGTIKSDKWSSCAMSIAFTVEK